jgi:hypothetical protein
MNCWERNQIWQVLELSGVWLEHSLEFADMCQRGKIRDVQENTLLYVLEDTVTETKPKDNKSTLMHTFRITKCIDLFVGDVIYYISNDFSHEHDNGFKRIL